MASPALSARRPVVLLCAGLLAWSGLGTTGSSASEGVRHVAHLDPGLRTVGAAVERVVVQAKAGALDAAERAARAAGGVVRAPLEIIDGFAADVPADRLRDLAQTPSVVAVTKDRAARFEQYSYDSSTTASNFVNSTQASTAWAAGDLGAGVGIAVLDTGVSPMNDLKGRVVWGPDLSGEGTYVDTFGHGTVMAGAAAGDGTDSQGQPGGALTGVAPKATIVAVKVAGRNGVADVSAMLQAMHWVAAYRQQYNIRVLNLSWGVPSTQDPTVDPVDYAVERLWRLGVVVVCAVGNTGPQSGTVIKPGDDPLVLTVGAYDDKQNTTPADDSVPPWSSRGPTAQGLTKPDLVAPGRYIVATRSYGSYIEATYPKALRDPSYIRGSGTSEATAITSGVVALLLAAHPTYTPDQVKAVLTGTASPMSNFGPNDQGAGRVQLAAALTAAPGPATWQTASGTGLGSLESSRAGVHVQTVCDGATTVVQGEVDYRCQPWGPAAWAGSIWSGDSWTGSIWSADNWSDASWNGSIWSGGTWTGGSWQGSAWNGSIWSGSIWSGTNWSGSIWSGSIWSGSNWSSDNWTSATYDDFQTAFWGNHPPYWMHLPGEVSDPAPPTCHRWRPC